MGLGLLLLLVPLGFLTGLLSGVLGIGGGLIFSPLLLLVGLDAHHALATSILAIVPTSLAASWAHMRSGTIPWRAGLAIGAGASFSAVLFSRLSHGLDSWQLLGLQALMYLGLSMAIKPKPVQEAAADRPLPLVALAGVGITAGLAGGMLGVGGGLVMVPLMVRYLAIPIHLAIRLSTLGVMASAATASVTFLSDGRAILPLALMLGCSAAVAAQWSATRLNRIPDHWLVWMLRGITLLLAADSGRRALALVLAGQST